MMDELIKPLSSVRREANFSGTNTEFKASRELIEYCIANKIIVSQVHPAEINKDFFNDYFAFLLNLSLDHLSTSPVEEIEMLESLEGFRKSYKILWEFGVIADLKRKLGVSESKQKVSQRSDTALTMEQFYELCKAQFGYAGSFGSFKKYVQKIYGSFAEYCLMKGYDINATKWEDEAVAIRVVEKLGSPEVVQVKSPSLYKFIVENDLFSKLGWHAA